MQCAVAAQFEWCVRLSRRAALKSCAVPPHIVRRANTPLGRADSPSPPPGGRRPLSGSPQSGELGGCRVAALQATLVSVVMAARWASPCCACWGWIGYVVEGEEAVGFVAVSKGCCQGKIRGKGVG